MVGQTADDFKQQEVRRELFLFIVHVVTDRISKLHEDLTEHFRNRGDVVPVRYVIDKHSCDALELNGEPIVTLDTQDLLSLGYREKCARDGFKFIPGNTDLLDLFFMRQFGNPSHMWRMECDVAYSGNIGKLFETLEREEADLICTRSRAPKYGWQHHKSVAVPDAWPAYSLQDPIVFLPFARVSARFMAALERFYEEGGRGHFEWTWPYVARAMNFDILDIGGTGPYTPPHYRNRYYPAPTALRRPTFDPRYIMRAPGSLPDTLWHPVKDWGAPKPRPLSESAAGHFLRHLVHENAALRRSLSRIGLVK